VLDLNARFVNHSTLDIVTVRIVVFVVVLCCCAVGVCGPSMFLCRFCELSFYCQVAVVLLSICCRFVIILLSICCRLVVIVVLSSISCRSAVDLRFVLGADLCFVD